MNILLIFFAFPIATIIISAILQRLLKNPIVVAALIFAIFLVVTFAAFDETFLIGTLAYTILAFITAFIVKLLFCNHNEDSDDEDDVNDLCRAVLRALERELNNNNNSSNNNNDSILDLIGGANNNNNDNCNLNSTTNTDSCGCGCNRNRFGRF